MPKASHCKCRCHQTELTQGSPFVFLGVSVVNPIEAVIACVECQDAHTPALFWKPPQPPAPPWVDPPPSNGDGPES